MVINQYDRRIITICNMDVGFYVLLIYKYIFSEFTDNNMQNTIHGLRFTHFVEYEPIKKKESKEKYVSLLA